MRCLCGGEKERQPRTTSGAASQIYLLAVGFLIFLLAGFFLAVLTVFVLHGTYLLSRLAYRDSVAAGGKNIHRTCRKFGKSQE